MEQEIIASNDTELDFQSSSSDGVDIEGFQNDGPLFAALYLIGFLFGLFGCISALISLKLMRRQGAETRFMLNMLIWLDFFAIISLFLTRYFLLIIYFCFLV